MMCRLILKLKYNIKAKLTKVMRYPHLIDDPQLSANVIQCLASDSQDGPLVDLKRRAMGEEYEFKVSNPKFENVSQKVVNQYIAYQTTATD